MATLSPTKKSSKRKLKQRKKKKKHQRGWSEGTKKYDFEEYKVPRKLGPIDMGRIKYKGTKYTDNDKYNFLKEKIHPHARSSSFTLRKQKNPVPKKPTVKQIGTPHSWKTPAFYELESQRMQRNISRLDFLLDTKPLHTRDKSLDKFKDSHIPKGQFAMASVQPFDWKPIDYEIQIDKNNFLTEKFWFDSSKIHIDIDENLSHLLQTLPPEKLLLIQDMPPPTGYESKLNYLQKLKSLVLEEARHNNNTYALNLLNITMNKLEALSDAENESDQSFNTNTNTNNLFNVTLDALNDGSESDNDTFILLNENENKNDSDNDIYNQNQTQTHFQFESQEFDNQMDNALKEVLASSPSPQIDYNDDILDQQMEDALSEILAPSPSPQPQPQPQPQHNDENNTKRLSRRDLLKTVRMNLNEVHRTSIINKDDIMASIAFENNDINNDSSNSSSNKELTESETDTSDIWISDIEPEPEADLLQDIKNEITNQLIDATVKCDELKQIVCDIGTNKNNDNEYKKHKHKRKHKHRRKFNGKIPSDFICPLTKGIINEAVMAADGRIYDRNAIENWLKCNDTSPIGGKNMRHKNLMPFIELTNKINLWKVKNISKKKRKRKKRKSGSVNKNKSSNNIIIALSPLQPSPELSPLSSLSGNEHNDVNDMNLNQNENENENVLEMGNDSSDHS